jgi:hypothetical protein
MKTETVLPLSYLDVFISFSRLFSLSKTFRIILSRNDESGQPCPVPDFGEKVSGYFLLLNVTLVVGFSYEAFIKLRYYPSLLSLLSVFCHERVLYFCQMLFLHQ